MAEQKTKPTERSINDFLDDIENEEVRDDCATLIRMMKKITKADPVLWSGNIVGFGRYYYKYDSGHEGYACLTGFSPRKQNITIYVMPGWGEQSEYLSKLGKHKASKGCLYIKKMADIDKDVLESLIRQSVDFLKKRYP